MNLDVTAETRPKWISFQLNRRAIRGTLVSSRFILAACLIHLAVGYRAANAADVTGRALFQAHCAECHGVNGEGNASKYSQALTGELSQDDLAKRIHETMPPDPKPKRTQEEAREIAQYIFTAFYSPTASAVHNRPRIEFRRLTARQYRYAIADIMTSFRGSTGPWDDQRGLQGSYNSVAENGDGKKAFDRLDPEIQFDFGRGSPDAEKMNPREFSMIWSGSIRAPLTGEYEIILRSENSVRLLLNNRVDPLIDGWVKSGDTREYRSTVKLLAGHGYPVLLTFTKSGQGVMKTPEQKAKQEITPANITLSWVPPDQNEQVIDREYLSPHHFPESFFVTTEFPPDDRSTGFERGSSVSKEWDRATTEAAIEVADYVVLRLRDLSGGAEPGSEYKTRLQEFCHQFVRRAFRRPLSVQETALYIDRQFESEDDPEAVVYNVVLLALKSPRFLYHGVGDSYGDQFGKASRLAFAMWDAPPDTILLNAAVDGKLGSREEVVQQAERMARHPLGRHKLREFLWQWMKLDQIRELKKSSEMFPGFDDSLASNLRQSLQRFLDDLIASDDCDFRRLFLNDTLYLNGQLAQIYGRGLQESASFHAVKLDGTPQYGILTHPFLMSYLADSTTTSPIRRGVFVARSVLGRALLPPPDAFSPLAPSLHPELNTRERVTLQTKAEACQKCHQMINPLGFTFEGYDAIGRFRREENGRSVDTSGEYQARNGTRTQFGSLADLANYLSESEEAHAAVVDKLFLFAVQQSIRAYGADTPNRIKSSFRESQYNMRKLLVEIATTAALEPPPTDTKSVNN